MKKIKRKPAGPKFNPAKVVLRKARVSDLPKLVELENNCFDYDQLSRRNFHYMITEAHSIFLVIEWEKRLIGYGLVLINAGTSLARLYSICTLEEFQGHGLGTKLISRLEELASDEEDCAYMRLEVKANNKSAIKLYEKLGYKKFTEKEGYYDDGQNALCFEKQVRVLKTTPRLKVPYYQQHTDFTCGPASLMMAMKTFSPKFDLSLSTELQIWRESTTIFMTSGHGGCGPRGLALSAWRRGYRTELYLSHSKVLFRESVRSQEKKEIIDIVHKDFEKKIAETSIQVHKKRLTLEDVRTILDNKGIPIILISTYHFDGHRVPHWVVITAFDEHFVYIHDPDMVTPEEHEGLMISRVHLPVPADQFLKISRWGKEKISAAVVLYSE